MRYNDHYMINTKLSINSRVILLKLLMRLNHFKLIRVTKLHIFKDIYTLL